MADRIGADTGGGFRGNTADFDTSFAAHQRGGFGAEQDPARNPGQSMVSNQLPGNPHSSSGFRRAIKSAGRSGNSLKDKLPSGVTFGGKGFRKPNYFAQGGKRHGMHISTGAPHTGAATQEGSDAGGV
jgi:hypothetical protein